MKNRILEEPMKETATPITAKKTLGDSQALDRSLVEQLPAGIFRKDADGRYVLVNSWFCRFHGKRPAQLLGRLPVDIAHHDPAVPPAPHHEEKIKFVKQGASHHEEIMRTGQTIELEEHYPIEDGDQHFLHVIKSPVFDADGTVIGSQGILMDITRRKQVEAALNQERNLLRALMDKSDDLIYFKDHESRFIRCSANFAKLFNVQSPEELIGRSDADFFAKEHAQAALEDEQKIIRTGKAVSARWKRKPGRTAM